MDSLSTKSHDLLTVPATLSSRRRSSLRRTSLSSAISLEAQNRARKERNIITTILKKPSVLRNEDDLETLAKYVKGYKAFATLSEFLLGQLCTVMALNEYEAGRAVFKQGEIGTAWYIIISGQVMVQITKTGNLADLFKIASLGVGVGFGELALINDKPRTATVVTEMKTELIRVEKADYNRIMKFSHEKDVKEKVMFLQRTMPFHDWTIASLKTIACDYF